MLIFLPSLTLPFHPHLTTSSHLVPQVEDLQVFLHLQQLMQCCSPSSHTGVQHRGSCLILQTQSHVLSHLSLSSCNIMRQAEELTKLKTQLFWRAEKKRSVFDSRGERGRRADGLVHFHSLFKPFTVPIALTGTWCVSSATSHPHQTRAHVVIWIRS